MTFLSREGLHAVLVIGLYLGFFGLAELVGRVLLPGKPEVSRKTVHFLGGLTALSFPYLFQSHWTILVLAAGFMAFLALTRRTTLLKSVDGVPRKSYGTFLFPVAFYLLFRLAQGRPVLYVIPILVLAVSDAVAALVGVKYGSVKFVIEGNTKSLEGSLSFLVIAFLCIHLPLLLMAPVGRLHSVLISLLIGVLVTIFELLSLAGSDNLFVPFGTYYLLDKLTRHPPSETVKLMELLAGIILVTALIFWRVKAVKGSGLIGMMLLNFAAWSLCGFEWFLPLFLSEIGFYLVVSAFRSQALRDIPEYHIRAVFYTALVPAALIFIANTIEDKRTIYLAYLSANASQLALIAIFYLCALLRERGGLDIRKLLAGGTVTAIASAILVSLPTLLAYHRGDPWAPLGVISAAAILGFLLNGLIHKLYYRKTYELFEDVARYRIRVLCIAFAVVLTFGATRVLGG